MMTWTLIIFVYGASVEVPGFKTREDCQAQMKAYGEGFKKDVNSGYFVACAGPVYMDVKPAKEAQSPK